MLSGTICVSLLGNLLRSKRIKAKMYGRGVVKTGWGEQERIFNATSFLTSLEIQIYYQN